LKPQTSKQKTEGFLNCIEAIWQLWRAKPDTVLVPGHDLSMRLDADGNPRYIGQRAAGISAWFSETLEQTTEFDLGGRAP
jgi:N-acyl homoserine lactone hydrolase